jgi:hypothetical protein
MCWVNGEMGDPDAGVRENIDLRVSACMLAYADSPLASGARADLHEGPGWSIRGEDDTGSDSATLALARALLAERQFDLQTGDLGGFPVVHRLRARPQRIAVAHGRVVNLNHCGLDRG